MLNFELSEKLLGEGMFGKVYKGHSKATKEVVAIKVTSRTFLAKSLKKKTQLDKEISFMKQINHPNIVRLIDTELTKASIHMVLEYCGGGDLARRLSSAPGKKLPENVARRFSRHLAAGLHCIWQSNLIHRDLKPQNLLLSTNNDATAVLKIADFGFVRQLGMGTLAETQCGSPLYMAPEILAGMHYDSKCDLWSVGVILFQMVTGEPPYKGRDTADLRNNLRRKPVVLPKGVKISMACKALLKRLLVKNPLQRCSYEEFFESEFLKADTTSTQPFRLDSSVLPANMKGLEPIAEGLSPPPPLPDNANLPPQVPPSPLRSGGGPKSKFAPTAGSAANPGRCPPSPSSQSYRQKLEEFNNATQRPAPSPNAPAGLGRMPAHHSRRPKDYRRTNSDPVQLRAYAALANQRNAAQTQNDLPTRALSLRHPNSSPLLEPAALPSLQKTESQSVPSSPHKEFWPSPSCGLSSAAKPIPMADYKLPPQAQATSHPASFHQQKTLASHEMERPPSVSSLLGVRSDSAPKPQGGDSNLSPTGSTEWEMVDATDSGAAREAAAQGRGTPVSRPRIGTAFPSASNNGFGIGSGVPAVAQDMVTDPAEDAQMVECMRACGRRVSSLVALADAKAANALSRESEAAYLSQVLCGVEEDPALEEGDDDSDKSAEDDAGQLYMECLVLYLNALRLVLNALTEIAGLKKNQARTEVTQWLQDLYKSILARASECRQRLSQLENSASLQTSALHILLHSSQTLAKTAVVKDLLGQETESQERYDQARILMEIFCLQQKVTESKKYSFKHYVDRKY